MKASFTTTKKGTWAYIRKSVRINGKSTTVPVKSLGLLSKIQEREGCDDPRQWVIDLAKKMTEEEKAGNAVVELPFHQNREVNPGECPLRMGGDLLLSSLYSSLGLPGICSKILKSGRAKYDLNEILRTLVMGRILFPASKTRTLESAKNFVFPPQFKEEEMFRSLSLLSDSINEVQAEVYKASQKFMARRQRVVYYDCTNYFFEIEDNDNDYIDTDTGELITGLRKRGKSKENRPNPIVQMGMFMDMDGIPLAFTVFPGNESEQTSLQPLEKMLNSSFGMTEFVVSTDAGLASESNRRYNMAEGRDYICVQSIPSLPKADQDMALDPRGWRVAFRKEGLPPIDPENPEKMIFNLSEVDLNAERHTKFYKEIIVYKRVEGKADTQRAERVIVTYSYDFALYLKHKRKERIKQAEKIVKHKQQKSRQSQQDPRRYVKTTYITPDGRKANRITMAINDNVIENEARFDGFYAYGTSLEDDAIEVLRARSFHHEIEHLFRTTKTFLKSRPVYLSRQDRIRSHFLICFLSMVIIKILQKQLDMPQTSIDELIQTLRDFNFGELPQGNYQPMFTRTELTDRLQALAGIKANFEIINKQKMRALYHKVNKY